MVRRIRPSLSRMPSPQSSTPQLLLTVSRSVAPRSCRASIRAPGMPHSPIPPTAREAPSWMSATASAALATTLLIIGILPLRLQSQFAGDQHQLDLRGALADFKDLGVAIVACHGELVDEAIAAEHLGGIPRVVHGCLACDHLSDGRLRLERLPGEHPGGRVVVGQPGGVGAGLHPGDLERYGLVFADVLAEGAALLGV